MECCICYDTNNLILYNHCIPVHVHQKCLDKCGNFDKCFVCRESILKDSKSFTEIDLLEPTRRTSTRRRRVQCWPFFCCDLFENLF
jgi:hypothetical protein